MQPKKLKPARLIIIAPDFKQGGGCFVIRDFVIAMLNAGHDVVVATPGGSLWPGCEGYGVRAITIDSATQTCPEPYDLMIFSWWESLLWASQIPAHRFVWICQSIEEFFPEPEDGAARIRAVVPYLLRGIDVIAVSPWVQAILQARFGTESHLIPNQLPSDIDWSAARRDRDWSAKRSPADCTVVVEGNTMRFKGIPASVNNCNRLGFGRKVLLVAGGGLNDQFRREIEFDGWRVFQNLPRTEVIRQMAEADILLRTSLLDSFGFAPLEMMATGGLVMAQHYQGAPGLCEHGVNSICFSSDAEILDAFRKNEESSGGYFRSLTRCGEATASGFVGCANYPYTDLISKLLDRPFDPTRSACLQGLCEAVNVAAGTSQSVFRDAALRHGLRVNGDHVQANIRSHPVRHLVADWIVLKVLKPLLPRKVLKAFRNWIWNRKI